MDSERRARRPRKRLRIKPNWKRNKRRDLWNKGQEYESLAKDPEKRHVAAKQMGRRCDCSLHCWDRVNGENRQKLFSGFYSLGSYDLQNIYLVGCIKVLPIKCRYGASNRHRYSRQYYVNVGGESVHVCQKAFLSIHAVSHGRVDWALRGQKLNGGMPKTDQRGKHTNRPNRIPGEDIQAVKTHIETFPRYISRYSRKDNPDREYLSPELNISRL